MPAIKYYRSRAGLKQEDLAAAIDVSRQLVSMWECGKAVPSTLLLPRIAAALDCTIDNLFENVPEAV